MTTTFSNITAETVTLANGQTETYKVANDTYYHAEAEDAVIHALEKARTNKSRIRLFYGDTATGKCWNEEFDIMGTIGRSCGSVKIPLLINNANSIGGTGILDHCIIKVVETKSKRTLFEHPNFDVGVLELREADAYTTTQGYPHSVFVDGVNQANFKTKEQAQRYIDFIKGLRNSK